MSHQYTLPQWFVLVLCGLLLSAVYLFFDLDDKFRQRMHDPRLGGAVLSRHANAQPSFAKLGLEFRRFTANNIFHPGYKIESGDALYSRIDTCEKAGVFKDGLFRSSKPASPCSIKLTLPQKFIKGIISLKVRSSSDFSIAIPEGRLYREFERSLPGIWNRSVSVEFNREKSDDGTHIFFQFKSLESDSIIEGIGFDEFQYVTQ